MPAETPPISAVELKQWRVQQLFSQEQVGDRLGVSHSAVNRWEKGDTIPGPADKLLRMLVRGEMPLDLPTAELGSQVREDIGAVEMTVEAFEECLRRAREAGFGSVTEWIADLVRAEGEEPQTLVRREVRYGKGKGKMKEDATAPNGGWPNVPDETRRE